MNLEGANSGGLGDGSPPAGSRGAEADDFSQLKGHLWHLGEGGMPPLPPPLPLNPPVASRIVSCSVVCVCQICLSHYACNVFLYLATGTQFRRTLASLLLARLPAGRRSSAAAASAATRLPPTAVDGTPAARRASSRARPGAGCPLLKPPPPPATREQTV